MFLLKLNKLKPDYTQEQVRLTMGIGYREITLAPDEVLWFYKTDIDTQGIDDSVVPIRFKNKKVVNWGKDVV